MISSLGAGDIVNLCFRNVLPETCSAFNLNNQAGPNFINVQAFNLASIDTSGFDIEASYRWQRPLGLPGRFTVRALATRDLRYLGLIGSRAKVARIYDQLLNEDHATLEQLSRVHAPIGLDIGAVTPQEIAVSIVAELIAIRRGRAKDIADASLRWVPKGKVPENA